MTPERAAIPHIAVTIGIGAFPEPVILWVH